MAVNKIMDSVGNVLIDLTSDTVTPDKVLEGHTFHDRSGAAQTGTLTTIPAGHTANYSEDNVVRFIDYNGEIVAEYSIAEANALQALPTPPVHEHLIFECWNHTLEQVQQTTHSLCIGALYNTVDDATYIHFYIPYPITLTVTITYYVTTVGDVTFDWGDGNTDTVTESSTGSKTYTHTYSKYGAYIIKITTTGDFYLQTGTSTSSNKIGLSTTHSQYITEFNFGTHQKHAMSFGGARCLKYFSIGTTFGGYNSNTFYGCTSLICVFATLTKQLPNSYVFANGTNNLHWISLNRTMACNIDTNFLAQGGSVTSLILPENAVIYYNFTPIPSFSYLYTSGYASNAAPLFQYCNILELPPMVWTIDSGGVTLINLPLCKTETITISKDTYSLNICNVGNLKKVTFTNNVTKIPALPYGGVLEEIDLTAIETPPVLSSSANCSCKIKVMRGTLSLYAAATNWSTLYAAGMLEEATE